MELPYRGGGGGGKCPTKHLMLPNKASSIKNGLHPFESLDKRVPYSTPQPPATSPAQVIAKAIGYSL